MGARGFSADAEHGVDADYDPREHTD